MLVDPSSKERTAVHRQVLRPQGSVHRCAALLLFTLVVAYGEEHPARAAAPAPATADAGETACEGTKVRVVGATAIERADACQGVQAARTFLVGQGLDGDSAFTVEITPTLPEPAGASAAGCYLQERSRAYMLTYAQFRKKRSWFGLPITRALYRALATHESAHGLAACSFAMKQPSIQAREYVAYVTMFSTMPAPMRERALRSLPGDGFQDIDRVSAFVYMFDPMRFGAQAYRHFARQADGAAVLRDVLSGKVLAE